MNITITPPAGTLSLISPSPPTVTVAPAMRPKANVIVLDVRARPSAPRRAELIHGPPLAA